MCQFLNGKMYAVHIHQAIAVELKQPFIIGMREDSDDCFLLLSVDTASV